MQRSRASQFLIVISVMHVRPADAERWASASYILVTFQACSCGFFLTPDFVSHFLFFFHLHLSPPRSSYLLRFIACLTSSSFASFLLAPYFSSPFIVPGLILAPCSSDAS